MTKLEPDAAPATETVPDCECVPRGYWEEHGAHFAACPLYGLVDALTPAIGWASEKDCTCTDCLDAASDAILRMLARISADRAALVEARARIEVLEALILKEFHGHTNNCKCVIAAEARAIELRKGK